MKHFCSTLFMALIFVSIPSLGASFDCTKARTEMEKTICNDSELNTADETLGRIYTQLRRTLPRSKFRRLKIKQRAWLKQERNMCNSDDVACILQKYQKKDGRFKAAFPCVQSF